MKILFQTGLNSGILSWKRSVEKQKLCHNQTAKVWLTCFQIVKWGALTSWDFLILLKSIRRLLKHFIKNHNYFTEGAINYIIQKSSTTNSFGTIFFLIWLTTHWKLNPLQLFIFKFHKLNVNLNVCKGETCLSNFF